MKATSTFRHPTPGRRACAVEIYACTKKNTAKICLDGTNTNVLHSYLKAMKDLDDWLRDGTDVLDLSGFFGPGHEIVRSRNGIFNIVFEYEGNLLTVPLEGHNLYGRGFCNEHGKFELDFGADSKFVHDKTFTKLDIGVNYSKLLGDFLGRTPTGLWPLRNAVQELCRFKGGSAKSIGPYVGTVAVHISEAARTAAVHSFICRAIMDPSLSRLNKAATGLFREGTAADVTELVIWIRKYNSLSHQLLQNIDRMYKGEKLHPIDGHGLDLTIQDLVTALRVCPMYAYTEGIFSIEKNKDGLRERRDVPENGRLPHITRRFSTVSSGLSPIAKAKSPIVMQTVLGRLPIELAALRECKEEVEMLLPMTSPIPNVRNWTVDGVISDAKSEDTKPLDKMQVDRRRAMIKTQLLTCYSRSLLKFVSTHKRSILGMMRLRRS